MVKLKNAHTGDVYSFASLSEEERGRVTGLAFSPETKQWETLLVQGRAAGSTETFWVPAEPGVDY